MLVGGTRQQREMCCCVSGDDWESVQREMCCCVSGDDSGDETLSKASARGAGSDSWGDDTDISLAEDKKTKVDVRE